MASKGLSHQSCGFCNSHVWMWELDCKESWALRNWCFWTMVLEKTLQSPLDCKEIQSVHPKRDQSWVFIGRTAAKTEAPILWPPDVKNWLIWKDPDTGRLKAGREGDDRGCDGWMASLTQWTWVWASSRSWWWTGKPGLLQSIGLQSVDATERLKWTKLNWSRCPRKHEVFQSGWCRRHFFFYCSVANLCPTLFDPMDCSRPVLPVLYSPLDFAQIHVHWVVDAI